MVAHLNVKSGRCLAPEDIENLEAGNLSEPELEQVFSHVSSCAQCETLLHGWQSSSKDELSDKLRQCLALEPIHRDHALSQMQARALDQTGPVMAREPAGFTVDSTSLSRSLIGTWIGQNRIVEEIGRGGMGIVFRAVQKSVNREVAVKVIRAGVFAEENALSRFRTEAGAIARLQHPNVAQLFEYSEHGGLPYVVMELVDGGSLETMLHDGPLPCRRAAELAREIALAVEYAHQRKVLHRDLKPSNILISRDGVPKIADFGLAKIMDEQEGHTQTDMILGTPSYMAPEQAFGRKEDIGCRTDVYALGALLYESLTGVPPYKGSDRLETLRQVRGKELTSPSRLRREIPRELEAICVKCLAKSPAKRYQSAQALADDLGLWLDHLRPREIPGFLGRSLTRLRRNWIGLALGLICMLVMGAIYLRDPDRPVREMQSQLAKGEPVTLIDAKGYPAWQRWLDGEDSSKLSLGGDETFGIHAPNVTLLELLPSVECDHYRFQVRIRHDKSSIPGDVGLYFARQTFMEGDIPIHFFMQLSFNDIRGKRDVPIIIGKRPLPEMINIAHVFPRLHTKEGVPPDIDCAMAGKGGPKFEPPGEGQTGWRDLAVTVSPQGVIAEWEGQAFYFSADDIRRSIRSQMTYLVEHDRRNAIMKKLNPDFFPRGGLGLFVYRGSASFCSASVIPQRDAQQ